MVQTTTRESAYIYWSFMMHKEVVFRVYWKTTSLMYKVDCSFPRLYALLMAEAESIYDCFERQQIDEMKR
jgi:hypothetical protein